MAELSAFPLFDPSRVHATLSRFVGVMQLLRSLVPRTDGPSPEPKSPKDAYVEALNTFVGTALPLPSASPLAVDGIVVLEYDGTATARPDVTATVSNALAHLRRGWPPVHALVCDVVAAIVVTVRPNFVGGSMTGLGVFWLEQGLGPEQVCAAEMRARFEAAMVASLCSLKGFLLF